MDEDPVEELSPSQHSTYRDTNDGDVMDQAFGDQGSGDNSPNQNYTEREETQHDPVPYGFHIE